MWDLKAAHCQDPGRVMIKEAEHEDERQENAENRNKKSKHLCSHDEHKRHYFGAL